MKQVDTPDISVCIATFRRPKELARLLNSLQSFETSEEFAMEVVIVDNDVRESARRVSESMHNKFTRLQYCVEPQQSISRARNRSIETACGTWIAFIDDDEVPGENWLAEYWQMLSKIPADGYFGPVLPRFEQVAPAWMDAEIFFGRPRYADGARMYKSLRTGNAFVRRSLFSTHKFDERFGLTGGEDAELFARMINAGAAFYWCDTAETFECYPSERLNLMWLLQQSFRKGYTYTLREMKHHDLYIHPILSLVKSMGGICLFTLMLPLELCRGRSYAVKRILRIALQCGHIWALLRLNYQAYEVKSK